MAGLSHSERTPFDLSVYFVVGEADVGSHDLVSVVSAAVRGGATLIQLREKDAEHEHVVALAKALKAALPPHVPLILNDHAEAALAAGADGVHLGQDDGPPAAARAILGPKAIIGLSVGNLAEAAVSDVSLVDYLGVGPVFATGTKVDAGAAIGPEGVQPVRQALDRPSVAIGGITVASAEAVIAAGADGVAVVSAIARADNPEAAAHDLKEAVLAGRRRAADHAIS